jgi:HK97 gp10 family phage protein
MSSITIHTEGLESLAKAMLEAAEESDAALIVANDVAAEFVKERAVALSRKHSKSIPPTIHVEHGGLINRVVTSSILGDLFERGNQGGRIGAAKSTFRHPVFGDWGPFKNRDAVVQKTHPFLAPAMRESRVEIVNTVTKGVRDLLDRFLSGRFPR